MSDDQTQEVAEEPTEQPVVQEEEVEQVEEEQTPVEETPEEQPEEPHESRSQQRISELVAQREEARRKVSELEKRVASQEDADAPKEDDFGSYEEYQRAAIRHEAKMALQAEREADIEAQRQTEGDLALQQFQIRAEAVRKKHADFDEVVGNQELPISQDMLQLMAESDVGADVAYHLGKNPAEARRLAMMPPAMMGREMARLELKMNAQPAPSIPTPIDTGSNVSGVGESTVPDLSKLSTEEYIKQRRSR